MTVKVAGPGSQAALEPGVTPLLSNKRYALSLVFPANQGHVAVLMLHVPAGETAPLHLQIEVERGRNWISLNRLERREV